MARRRAKDEDGQFLGDNPETPEINEDWVEKEETEAVKESSTQPAVFKLQTSAETTNPPEKVSKEEIEAAIKEKLSRKTDQGLDPFVPNSQLENEIKSVAQKQGFPLNRGTEVGARLIARSNRGLK